MFIWDILFKSKFGSAKIEKLSIQYAIVYTEMCTLVGLPFPSNEGGDFMYAKEDANRIAQ